MNAPTRFALAAAFAIAACPTPAQVWEKYLAPGLMYRMEYDQDTPRVIHALRFDMHSTQVRAMPELGQLKVYNDDKTKGRAKVSDLVKRTGALAGVNANYFPYTGRPVGLMVRNKELISSPYPTRPVFGWGPNCYTAFGLPTFSASFEAEGSQPVEIDSINDEAPPGSLCLNTETAALALTKNCTGSCATIHVVDGSFRPDAKVVGRVVSVSPGCSKMEIGPGDVTLMGTGPKAALVNALEPGKRVVFRIHTDGLDWKKVRNCVCGGPVLLRDSQKVVDSGAEGFSKTFSEKRFPRTAVGRDGHGNMWLVVVDQNKASAGATLDEMADVMLSLGCRDALNLDGGGSSTLDILGLTMNRPTADTERPVANAILLFGPTAAKEETQLSIKGPSAVAVGDKIELKLVKADGAEVPNGEVLWSASGAGWIDQGGTLRVLAMGPVSVTAFAHGQTLTATYTSQ